MVDEILETRALDALLLTDLPSNGDTGPQVQERNELGEGAQDAAVAHGLCVLAEDVAGDEPGDDAGRAVVEAPEDSVSPLARHGDRFARLLRIGSRKKGPPARRLEKWQELKKPRFVLRFIRSRAREECAAKRDTPRPYYFSGGKAYNF